MCVGGGGRLGFQIPMSLLKLMLLTWVSADTILREIVTCLRLSNLSLIQLGLDFIHVTPKHVFLDFPYSSLLGHLTSNTSKVSFLIGMSQHRNP